MSKIIKIRFTKTRAYIWDWRRKTEWKKGCTEKLKKKKKKTDRDWIGGEQEKGKRKKTKV